MNDLNKKIQVLLDRFTAEGTERGIQVAVYFEGQLVVDACSGLANVVTGERVTSETLFPVFSVSKGIAATIVHRVVEKGLLSYDSPIVDVWPEFSRHGKERITLRHALNHTAGIPYMPHGIGFVEVCDWDGMCAAVAGLEPASSPGFKAEYHAITYGWLVGETARRATGAASFQQMIEEEICRPLGMDGIYIGIPDRVETRVALLESDDIASAVTNDAKPEAIPAWLGPLHEMMNRPDVRRACLPASSGIMSAKAIARHYAALLPGGVDGVALLSPERMREALAPQKVEEPPNGFSTKVLGYQPMQEGYTPGEVVTVFGHGGHGGAIGMANVDAGFAVGITRNLFRNQNSAQLILNELPAAL